MPPPGNGTALPGSARATGRSQQKQQHPHQHRHLPSQQQHQQQQQQQPQPDSSSLWTTTELILFVSSISCLMSFLAFAGSWGFFYLTNATKPANQHIWHPFQFTTTTLGTAVPGVSQSLDSMAGTSIGASTSVYIPGRFKGVDLSSPLPDHLAPKALFSVVGGGPPNVKSAVQFHWVITSCDRYQWGRLMSSTLLSGVFNGLQPTTISVVWCHPYSQGKVPSLLLNLRHSHAINIFFPNEQLLGRGQVTRMEATYLTALMVPRALGMAHLPTLITEDDVWVSPDANVRLRAAVRRIENEAGRAPYMLQCYQADGVGPAPESEQGIIQPADDVDGRKAWRSHTLKGDGITLVHTLNYGAQANLFSAALTAMMLTEWLKFIEPGKNHTDRLQDMHVVHMLQNEWQCNAHQHDCYYYTMYPSLVQHLGTSSSLFNKDDNGKDHKLNQRWHVARDFPVRLTFPGYDPEGTWRRRRRTRARKLLHQGGASGPRTA